MFWNSSTRDQPVKSEVTIRRLCRVVSALLVCCVCFVSASAQSVMDHGAKPADQTAAPHHHDHNSTSTKPAEPSVTPRSGAPLKRPGAVTVGDVQIAIPDLLVLDQDGKERRFYSDLIKDKVVVLSFFFTSCVSVCPAMSMALKKLQSNLGDRLGKDVFIITVTKDPETDTPRQLRAWGKDIGVKPGWTMVTGELKVIEKIVRDFTGDPLGRAAHNTVFILGSDRTGDWADLPEFTTPVELRQQIDLLTQPTRTQSQNRER